jgi:hypothetical protein
MKYFINEHKLTETIESYILKNYPEVAKVYFTKHGVHLVSGDFEKEEDRTIICTVINVVLDNMEGKYKEYQLREMSRPIRGNVNSMFGLSTQEYGSKWDFKFKQLGIVDL